MPIFNEDDSRRIARTVMRVEHEPRGGTPDRAADLPVSPSVQVVRVTSATPTSGRHPAKVQLYDAAANAWSDLGDCWAVDPAGTGLAATSYHARRWGEYAGKPVFSVSEIVGGSVSSTLTVREVDGSPSLPLSVPASPTLEFDSADGFAVSSGGTGVARVDIRAATATQAGVVSTGDQVFAGQKDFSWGAVVGRVDGDAALFAELYFNSFYSTNHREQSRIRVVEGPSADLAEDYQTMILTAGFGLSNSGSEKNAELWIDAHAQAFYFYAWTGTSTKATPNIYIGTGTGDVQGQTTTVAGLSFTAGWLTGGSFAGAVLNATQTFTATQTFNPGTSQANAIVIGCTPLGSAGQRDSHYLVIQATANNPGEHPVEWRQWVDVTSNAGASTFKLQSSLDGGAFADRLTLTDAGNGVFAGTLAASNLSGTNTGDQTVTLTGDVTGSGTGSFAATIASGAVTFAKMQAVSADVLLGNDSSGTAVQEIACTATARSILDDTSTGAVLTTLGGTTVGQSVFTLANPSAITFLRVNADNTVDALSASAFRTAVGAGTGSGDALTSGTLAQFASTTSLQLKGVISDETGSGALVFATSPTLVTPTLGAATATSLNGNTVTTGTGTLTLSTFTLTVAGTASVSGTNTGDQVLPTRASLGLDTTDSPQFAAVNLGHASDTTLTRVSAGVMAVEGATVATLSTAQTWSAAQTFPNAGLKVQDTAGNNTLTLKFNEDAGADCVLNLRVLSADRTLELGGNLTVSAAATVSNTNTGDVTLAGETYITITGQAITATRVTEAQQNVTDVTTANVSSTAHGYAPKSPADATKFLNGAATPAYALVKDSDLSTSDITTNNASTTKHGFAPKLDNTATHYLDGTGAWSTPASGSLDITGLSAADPALDDQAPIYDTSATANRKAQVDRLLGLLRVAPGGRLTLVSGTPVTTSDTTSTTLYYTPYFHDIIVLWDGTRWVPVQFAEKSLSLTLTSGSAYDVWGYLSSGTLALETLVWTSTAARATAITYQDGRYCKSGDKTRLYLGSLLASAANTAKSAVGFQYAYNHYNRVRMPLLLQLSGNHDYTTNSYRAWNNDGGNCVKVFVGTDDGEVFLHALGLTYNSGANSANLGIGLDSTTANSAGIRDSDTNFNGGGMSHALYRGRPGVGLHTFTLLERSTATGTTTWYGGHGVDCVGGMDGYLMG